MVLMISGNYKNESERGSPHQLPNLLFSSNEFQEFLKGHSHVEHIFQIFCATRKCIFDQIRQCNSQQEFMNLQEKL